MQFLRFLLFPFSLVYGLITFIRNKCYDWGIFSSYEIPLKSICVGNLSTGGTGKTPHVAWIAEEFSSEIETSILSRGYGRTTKGFKLVSSTSLAREVGDEPLFYAGKFKAKVHVAVCEKRKDGIQKLIDLFPNNRLIILDDAFQHRAVKAGFSVLLTEYNTPFTKDYMLPTGNLREWPIGKHRADCIIVTKCPSEVDETAKKNFTNSLNFSSDRVFFSKIAYGPVVPVLLKVEEPVSILLVTGIANAKPLVRHLNNYYQVEHLEYSDHYAFTQKDIQEIHQKFDTFASDPKIILTTEKDYMRLSEFVKDWKMEEYPWYYQPITVEIDEEEQFKALLNSYVRTI